ncbi:hypothetical protein Tco_0464791 [Tanacetum coccineum]
MGLTRLARVLLLYLEYEAEKERQLKRNVQSKRSPIKYEGADLNSFHWDKSRTFNYSYYHEDVEIDKYHDLPPLHPCFQSTQLYTEDGLVSYNESDKVDNCWEIDCKRLNTGSITIWEAIRTRFGGNTNSKKMQKAIFKQQFEAFKISSTEGLEKGYDRFQQLPSQLEAHGAKVSTEDANHKFLRSLPAAWSNLAMTRRTKPEVDTLSIDDLYNNLRVFEQEIQGASKTSSSAQNVAFVSQSKSNTNKVKSGFTGAYSTCIPSTSSTNIPEKEVPAGFADEVIYSLFAKQLED